MLFQSSLFTSTNIIWLQRTAETRANLRFSTLIPNKVSGMYWPELTTVLASDQCPNQLENILLNGTLSHCSNEDRRLQLNSYSNTSNYAILAYLKKRNQLKTCLTKLKKFPGNWSDFWQNKDPLVLKMKTPRHTYKHTARSIADPGHHMFFMHHKCWRNINE